MLPDAARYFHAFIAAMLTLRLRARYTMLRDVLRLPILLFCADDAFRCRLLRRLRDAAASMLRLHVADAAMMPPYCC